MAASFVNSATATNLSPATTISLTVPGGTPDGHYLFAAISTDGGSGSTITPPAGWTLIRTVTIATGSRTSIYWRIAASDGGVSYTWTLDTSRVAVTAMMVYKDTLRTNPVDADNGQSNAASNSMTAPGVTTTLENDLLIGVWSNTNPVGSTVTPPAGWTLRYDLGFNLSVADVLMVTPGASGNKVATSSGSAFANSGLLVAVKSQPILMEADRLTGGMQSLDSNFQ